MSDIAKQIIKDSNTGSLGTIGSDGNPFVSLVTVAATGPTSLVMLLSGLAKHPSASMYVDFGDFAFYELNIAEAYLVAGFGRIETIPASVLADS